MPKQLSSYIRLLNLSLALFVLSACGGGGGGKTTPSYTLTATAGEHGGISPGDATVQQDETATFTITPDSGYGIESIRGCGGSLDGTTYTTGPITAACEVNVTFSLLAPATAASLSLTLNPVKTLAFSWDEVSDATFYRLLENPDGVSGFSQRGGDIAQGTGHASITVPLYQRLNARYLLQSCNTAGCTDSSTVNVSGNLAEAIGYLKASNTDIRDTFGRSLALSADGTTLAVGANGEDSRFQGNQRDNGAESAGAVYVFILADGLWQRQAYLKARYPEEEDEFGQSLSLSHDGNTLAIGAPGESSGSTGINGDQTDNSRQYSGAVYVFTRDGSRWERQAYLKSRAPDVDDKFGWSVSLSGTGNRLAVGVPYEDSNGDSTSDNSLTNSGAVYTFQRDGSNWSYLQYSKARHADSNDNFGWSVSLDEAGSTLAIGAMGEDSNANGIDGNQSNNDMSASGAVYIFTDSGADWDQQSYIKASNTDISDRFGHSVALSHDGRTLAVGATDESSSATGVNGDQHNNESLSSGAAYVFAFDSGAWAQQAYIKASNTDPSDLFGRVVRLSGDGNILAVSTYAEASNATGIGGDEADNSTLGAGAVYTFTRQSGSWSQQAYIKASNTEGDSFGSTIALSGDGNTLAVGATGESSSDTGINGNQADNSATASGAVYLY